MDDAQSHRPANGWSFTTMLRYIISLIEANDRLTAERFAASEKAVNAALAAADKSVSTAMVAAEKAVNAALTASDKAVAKAEESQQRVNITQDEFRGQLKDQAATFATSKELDVRLDSIYTRLSVLEKTGAGIAGRDDGKGKITGILWSIAVAVATAGLIMLLTQVIGR